MTHQKQPTCTWSTPMKTTQRYVKGNINSFLLNNSFQALFRTRKISPGNTNPIISLGIIQISIHSPKVITAQQVHMPQMCNSSAHQENWFLTELSDPRWQELPSVWRSNDFMINLGNWFVLRIPSVFWIHLRYVPTFVYVNNVNKDIWERNEWYTELL